MSDIRLLLQHGDSVARHARAVAATPSGDVVWEPGGLGAAVPAVRGGCVAFFTRTGRSGGAVDPQSWHGGAAVAGESLTQACGDGFCSGAKWTLQKFREAPADGGGRHLTDAAAAAAFAAEHATLRPCRGGGVRFEVD